jgi:hypothetical protein
MKEDHDLHDLNIEPWINEAGHEHRARRAFEAARAQIREERRVFQLVYAGERLATREEIERVRLAGPRRRDGYGPGGLGPALVATAVLVGWAVVAFLLFWFAAAVLGF